MTSTRRLGAEHSTTRGDLLDSALTLMLEEGYAAVTSRKLAAKAGLKPQLVHYYFRTMDDLFRALVRRGAELNLQRQASALASPMPLHALWELASDPAGTILTMEFSALANHRKAIRAELAAYAEQFRQIQIEVLSHLSERFGADPQVVSPAAASVLLTSISQILGMEAALGVTTGHGEAREMVQRWIARYEPATSE